MSTHLHPARLATRHTASPTGTSSLTSQFFAGLMVWRQRQHLAHLDCARLRDIGITRAEAEAESRRPFWDIPARWRRG